MIKIKYTNEFVEVYDDGNKQLLIRNFGTVIPEDKEVNLLCIAEIYDLNNSGAMRTEDIDELSKGRGYIQLSFSLLPEEKFISKKHKKSANDSNCSICGDTIVNVYEYMGGLLYEPESEGKVWFKTNEDALDYLKSKSLNNKISSSGVLSRFAMDKYYNRIGETNWNRLEKIMNER